MVLSLMPTIALADDSAAETIEDAILYTINDGGELEYNVTHAAPVSDTVAVSGEGLDSLAELEAVMGEVDKPAVALGTDPGQRTIGKAVTADLGLDADGSVVSITVTDISERPIVGISWKKDTIGTDYQGFAEAYERNGAIAVYLPQVHNAEEAQEVLSQIDGIFFTGGEDWNPSLYDEVQSPHGSSGWNDARDTSDINLMQQAVEMDVPLFAVCRGEQGFNVAMGGGLIQDIPYYLGQKVISGEIDASRVTRVMSGAIPSTVEGYENLSDEIKQPVQDTGYTYYDEDYQKIGKTYLGYNEDTQSYEYADYDTGCEEGHLRVNIDGLIHSGAPSYHELEAKNDGIGVSEDSKWLYDIVGDTTIDLVATAHHQAVNPEKLGDGLTIVAKSSDGIVEAIEHQDSLFALALQWHPERDALGDSRGVDVDNDLCNALLGSLVEYASVHYERENPTGSYTGGGSSSGSSGGSSSSSVTYTVSVSDTENGTVTVSPKSAKAGATVTITVKPDAGFELASIEVTDQNGSGITVKGDDRTYTFAMPKSSATVTASFQAGAASAEGLPFTDVSDDFWAYDAIEWAYENGYMNGKTATTFQPDGSVTRQQLWMILARLSGANPADMAEARTWAMSTGVSDGSDPGTAVSRQQMVTMLYRYAGLMGYTVSGTADLASYPDSASVSGYAQDAMSWSVANGIVAGTASGTLDPAGTATRAQFSVILMRFCEKMA